ncbi:hypothetical protein EYV94_02980 [Puteibacter caeruleilacunae]|nr:hypothetical protein EYV94_02980 [Puteibacter caeruleilacunae]
MRYIILLTLIFTASISFGQLKGYVFWDENGNEIKDKGEQNVENAILSDGFNVVKSNKSGEFKLPGWEKQRFVTIYPGANMACQQRFIRINKNTKAYTFAVQPKQKKQDVRFVQISDTETFEHREWVDNLKEYARIHQPDFIVHTGDICYETGMKWHSENLTSKDVGVPLYYCLGNHDLIKGTYGEEYFEKCFGPAWYAFEEGNSVYVVTPMMGGDYKPGFTRDDIGGWLKNLLNTYEEQQPKVFFNHDLLTESEDFLFKIKGNESINLTDYNLKAWLYGHWHVNRFKEHGDKGVVSYGTATAVMGGIDHSPSGFRVINVDAKGDTKSHFRWTYLNREIEIVSPQKELVQLDDQGNVRIAVNTYHTGAEVDSVKYAIWGEEGFNWKSSMQTDKWKKMTQQSDWNWEADFKPFSQKHYMLVIDAYLKNGDILHTKRNFSTSNASNDITPQTDWTNLGGNKEHHATVKMFHGMPYKLKWSANVGSNIYMSSPVVLGNKVITASFDDGSASDCYVVCFDANSGKECWKNKIDNGIKNQMVIAQGLVIGTDVLGFTYAFDVATGKLVWKRDLEYKRLPAFISGIVTDGEVVYTGFGSSLCALEAATGDIIWRNKDWNGGEGTTPTMTIADDILIVSRHWGSLYAHDRKTGKVLWSRGDDGLRFRDGVISYVDGKLWLAGRGNQDFGKGALFQLDPKTGKTIKKTATGMQHTGTSAPLILENQFIVASSDPGIAAIERESGKKKWQFEVGDALLYTPSYFSDRQQSIESTPVLIGDKVVFGAMDGCVYVLDSATGRLMWKAELGAPVMTSVAVADHCIYICDFAGNIYCYQEN